MTYSDDRLRDAILEQFQAELAIAGLNMKALAERMGRPYDSTRNYLKGERAMPVEFLIDASRTLGIAPDALIARARQRIE